MAEKQRRASLPRKKGQTHKTKFSQDALGSVVPSRFHSSVHRPRFQIKTKCRDFPPLRRQTDQARHPKGTTRFGAASCCPTPNTKKPASFSNEFASRRAHTHTHTHTHTDPLSDTPSPDTFTHTHTHTLQQTDTKSCRHDEQPRQPQQQFSER